MNEYVVSMDEAEKTLYWMVERGGILKWKSADLSRPGSSISTPARTYMDTPYPKPAYWVQSEPVVFKDMNAVILTVDEEVKRFHVAIRPGSNGLVFKCTRASSERIQNALEKAGEGSSYAFDYGSQEAVIYKQSPHMTLQEYVDRRIKECVK